jgi:hypothetical protein
MTPLDVPSLRALSDFPLDPEVVRHATEKARTSTKHVHLYGTALDRLAKGDSPEEVFGLLLAENEKYNHPPLDAAEVEAVLQAAISSVRDSDRPPLRLSPLLNASEWVNLDLSTAQSAVIVGTPKSPVLRADTRNMVLAEKKAMKTPFAQKCFLEVPAGVTRSRPLPAGGPYMVLYIHGESPEHQVTGRTIAAVRGLPSPPVNFYQVREHRAHLVDDAGQQIMEWRILQALESEAREKRRGGLQLVLDP